MFAAASRNNAIADIRFSIYLFDALDPSIVSRKMEK